MRSLKFFTILLFLLSLLSCDYYNRWQLFYSACKGEEDCKRFKRSLENWEKDLKSRPNYKKLISEKGVDENENGLRDDVEIYIDHHLDALKGRHWMAKRPFKMYGAILQSYSQLKPTSEALKFFDKDYEKQGKCLDAIFFAESLSGNSIPYINAKIRYLVIQEWREKFNIDNHFFKKFNHSTKLSIPKVQIDSVTNCGVSFEQMGEYKNRIFTWGGRKSREQIQIDLLDYEKRYGKKDRSKYEEYLD